ncbi:MAG TPA: hypothetical protein VN766_10850 [Stellaceae bacterium]|jgi:hypothetical protein|nr:hypothetical protein [Stellaceae bacterium]
MLKQFALATVPLLVAAHFAAAAEPMKLTNAQMDGVTAGSASGALIQLSASASGTPQAFTETAAEAFVTQTPVLFATPLGPVKLSAGTVYAIGASVSSN